MKRMKKLFAVILSLAMVMGMSLTAFADDPVKPEAKGTSEDKGTITVNGIDDTKDTSSVTAYPIVTAKYDESTGNFIGFNNDWKIADIEHPTEQELANIAAGKMANLVAGEETLQNKTLPAGIALTKQDDGSYKNTEPLGIGMYLILVSGAETYVYNPAVASINYVSADGKVVIDSTKVLTMGTTVSGTNTWIKKSNQPDLDKKVKNETLKENTFTTGNTANIGDTLVYNVTINPIPNYGGNFPKLKVNDTLSTGLTYVANSLNVKIGETALKGLDVSDSTKEYNYEGIQYTYKINGQNIEIDFVVNGVYQLNGFSGQGAVIEYKATVNEDAKLNELGNNNDATLSYSKNSTIDGSEGTKDKKTYTYTFDIDGTLTGEGKENIIDTTHIINKLGEEVGTIETENGTKKVKKPLAKAVFGLFTDASASTPYQNSATGFSGANIESDKDGQLHMTGLAAGTYYLKEIKAPAGYSVNSQIIPVVISASYDNEGKLIKWSVTVGGTLTKEFNITYDANKNITVAGEDKIVAAVTI